MPNRCRTIPSIVLLALLFAATALAGTLNQGVEGIALADLFPGATFDPNIPAQVEITGVSIATIGALLRNAEKIATGALMRIRPPRSLFAHDVPPT